MSDETVIDAQESHVGEALRRAREEMGLQQADIAKELRLSLQTIKDIEAHDFRQSHALTYVKGYLRGYARMVNLPAEDVIERFAGSEWAQEQIALRQPKQAKPTMTMQELPKRTRRNKHYARWIGLGLMLGLMGLVIVWWHGQKSQPHLDIQSKPLLALPEQTTPVTLTETKKG